MTSGEGQKYRVAYLAGVLFALAFFFLVWHCARKALLDSGVGNTGLASFALGRNMGRKTDGCV